MFEIKCDKCGLIIKIYSLSDYPFCPQCGQGAPDNEFYYQVGIHGSKEGAFGVFLDAAMDAGYTEKEADKIGEEIGAAHVGYEAIINVKFKDKILTIESIVMNGKKFLQVFT